MTTTHHGPQMAQDAFFLTTPRSAAAFAQARHGSLRQAVESQIERLIAFLDFVDGDPDLESEADAEDGHDFEQTDGAPVMIAACGRMVRL